MLKACPSADAQKATVLHAQWAQSPRSHPSKKPGQEMCWPCKATLQRVRSELKSHWQDSLYESHSSSHKPLPSDLLHAASAIQLSQVSTL